MDEQTYKVWSELHRRRIFGEPMTDEEWAAHEAGCQEIDATTRYDGSLAYQQEMLKRLDAVEERQRRLTELEATLDARIAALESELTETMPRQSASGN